MAMEKQAIELASEILSEMDWRDYPAPVWCKLRRVCPRCHETANKRSDCKGCQWVK